jgi:hypothetical protein
VKIVKCLPVFTIALGKIKETEGLSDIAWALTYISGEYTILLRSKCLDGDNLRAKIIMENEVLPLLLPLLSHDNVSLILPVLRVFGNVMAGDSAYTEVLQSPFSLRRIAIGDLEDGYSQ